MSNKTLVVCSHANWIAQDFIDATIDSYDIIADKGFDLPKIKPNSNVAWWMPTEHAVKLAYSGFSLPFMAPGTHWLSSLPEALTMRNIVSTSIAELDANPYDGKRWIKPAEFKHQQFFAGAYTVEEVMDFQLPQNAIIQYTDTILSLDEEYRFYVVDGKVTTGSIYLSDSITYYDGATEKRYTEAYDYAQYVVDCLQWNQPPSYTLDVAYDTEINDWLVVEGNPAFSSAIYGSDPAIVVDALLRCANPVEGDEAWMWLPDPYLLHKYANMRPLR